VLEDWSVGGVECWRIGVLEDWSVGGVEGCLPDTDEGGGGEEWSNGVMMEENSDLRIGWKFISL